MKKDGLYGDMLFISIFYHYTIEGIHSFKLRSEHEVIDILCELSEELKYKSLFDSYPVDRDNQTSINLIDGWEQLFLTSMLQTTSGKEYIISSSLRARYEKHIDIFLSGEKKELLRELSLKVKQKLHETRNKTLISK